MNGWEGIPSKGHGYPDAWGVGHTGAGPAGGEGGAG